jgi:hypothetical protein
VNEGVKQRHKNLMEIGPAKEAAKRRVSPGRAPLLTSGSRVEIRARAAPARSRKPGISQVVRTECESRSVKFPWGFLRRFCERIRAVAASLSAACTGFRPSRRATDLRLLKLIRGSERTNE